MATVHFTAKVKDTRTLELPEEAQELGLTPGEEVSIRLDTNGVGTTAAFSPNEKGLAAMRQIAERQKSRPISPDTTTRKLLHEARSGAMYGYDPTDKYPAPWRRP
jgi:hypothetical protein